MPFPRKADRMPVDSGAAQAQPPVYHESFEDGVPEYFRVTRPGSLSTSHRHSKEGKSSLRWDWSRGEELVIRRGIGDPARVGGYRCRACFAVWVYVEQPVPDALVFEFREGENSTGSFRFPLAFTGWRQGRPYYHAFPQGQPTSRVDNIRITAPTRVAGGTVFLDLVKYNTLTYGGNAIIPEKEAQWGRPVPDERRFPRPVRVTEAELAGIRKLLGLDTGPSIPQAQVDDLCRQAEALGILRDGGGVRGGPGIDANYQYLAAVGEHGITDIAYWLDENGPDWLGMQTPGPMSSLARQVANAYRSSNDEGQRRRLADAFLLVADYLQDQALQAGSGFKWHWWVGGEWADAVFLMRDTLAAADRLQPHLDFLIYTYDGGAIFAEGDAPSHMDFYNLTVPRMLHQCLMQPEPAEQVRWLRAFKAMLERSMLQPTSAFKIDGSAYHHAGHYHSYAQGAFASLPTVLQELRDTPWRINAEAHERLRRAMLAQRIYANRHDLPLSLTGRSPFSPGYGVITTPGLRGLRILSQCGTPDGQDTVDREVAAAYLRLDPEAAGEEPYLGLGIQPEPEPNGTFVMPYAGLLSHRRDDWLASVRGQSRYVWGSERQARRNCHGYYLGLGHLEILAGGSPVSAAASGRTAPGWDWRRFEGTTAPQLPLDRMEQAFAALARSPEAFVGGLSHRGRQGAFAMVLNQPLPDGKTLAGRKSWFFFDEQVLCLGSDITSDEGAVPTQTTLCQRALAGRGHGAFVPTVLDGADFADCPGERALEETGPHWFIDVQQTGYALPAGQKISVARRRQISRDVDDAADTEGDFLTAWIDHGRAPRASGYEYALVVRATPEAMRRVIADPPYRMLQCDQAAHVVWQAGGGLWGCVCFVPQRIPPHAVAGDVLPIGSVDRPCLLMAEALPEDQLDLSVADPDLNLEKEVNQPQPLRVALHGGWRLLQARGKVCAWPLPDPTDAVRILSVTATETVVEIICRHGASYDIRFARK
ncbi:MAG: hypothetical protein EXS64_20780 [Candidatus Latescibacteria bacterium]|nr:hypothetical protein [Candidatus Latescibacterota bacterium]